MTISRDVMATGFGWVKYKGKIHQEDIIITARGEVMRRDQDEIMRKYGTLRAISLNEMRILLADNPEVIVVGIGQSDSLRMPPEALEMLEKSSSRLVQGSSPKAVKYFEQFTGTKAALIHVK
ncbi:MAG: hypothetical protein KKE23_00675 [Nanoarchaeota archaeon]|nr:hypothetical protein [Nanoarchaeota archaeon]